MKNLKVITTECNRVINGLNTLKESVGAFAIIGFYDKLTLQCDERLIKWLEKNKLEFNSEFIGDKAYETDDFILFCYKKDK